MLSVKMTSGEMLDAFRARLAARRAARIEAPWYTDPAPRRGEECASCGAAAEPMTVIVIYGVTTGATREEWHCTDVAACNLRRTPALRDVLPPTPPAPPPACRAAPAPPRVAAFCRNLANHGWPLDEPPRLHPDLWTDPFAPEYGFPTFGGLVLGVIADIGQALASHPPR